MREDDIYSAVAVTIDLLAKKIAKETSKSLQKIIEGNHNRLQQDSWKHLLTVREVEICEKIIFSGMTSKELSQAYNVTVSCIGWYRQRIRRKTNCPANKDLRTHLLSLQNKSGLSIV
jgi:DNA-binding CsgD family transcriptional regulator